MRPRRQRLQVSTFPFLAVLLCAMGSLILLMLVIDRRAKVVARAKAMQVLARRQEETSASLRARQAEWEQRRQQLRVQLALQKEEAVGQLKQLEQKQLQQGTNLASEREKIRDLQTQVQEAIKLLSTEQQDIEREKNELRSPDKRIQLSQAEMARLSVELVQLERTLRDLQASRKQETKLFSVVPYQGKRGDNRRPIYLECQATQVVMHPERKTLTGAGRTLQGMRDEVEHRIPKTPSKKPDGEEQPRAYVMFLVRPDGIATYYQATVALQGLPIDFGYEFLDADWVLDFPTDDQAPASQPWMAAKPSPAPFDSAPASRPRTATAGVPAGWPNTRMGTLQAPAGSGSNQIAGSIPTSGFAGGRQGNGSSEPGSWVGGGGPRIPVFGSDGSDKPGNATSGNPDMVGGGQGKGFPNLGSRTGGSNSRVPVFGSDGSDKPGNATSGNPGLVGSGSKFRVPVFGPGGLDGSGDSLAGAPTMNGSKREGQPSGPNLNPLMRTSPGENAASASPPQDPPFGSGSTASGSAPRAQESAPASSGNAPLRAESARVQSPTPASAGSGNSGTPTDPAAMPISAGSMNPSGVAETSNPGGGTSAASAPPATGQGNAGGAAGAGAALQDIEAGSSSGPGPSRTALDNLAGPLPPRSKGRDKAPPSVILAGNRDWVITLECNKDSLEIAQTRQRFTLEEAGEIKPENNRLLRAVQLLIQRRQATVRAGEPPYRPMIRFRVHSGGMRTYYLAYPILGVLQLPMSHENLEHEDALKRQRLPGQGG